MEAGKLTHLWLERLGWLEDGLPADADLLALARARGWAPAVAAERLATLHQSLAAPAIRDLLSRTATLARANAAMLAARDASGQPKPEPNPDFELELRREWPFALRDDDALVTGQIDRLIIARRGGRPVWAEVIDFKTDAVEAVEDLAERYGEQIEDYRRSMAALFNLDLAAVRCLVVSTHLPGLLEIRPAG
jgi:ATP-dependent exoDNAse (exonuclease V) beta subunit